MYDNNDLMTGFALGKDSSSNNGGNGGGFGGWGGAWEGIWGIIILAMVFGWGNGGWGGFGGGNGGATNAFLPYAVGGNGALTRSDLCQDMNFSQLENGVRGIADGLCALGYDQLAQINGVNSNIAAMGANLNNAVCTLGYQNAQLISGLENTVQNGFNAMNISNLQTANAANVIAMQNQNALSTQLADCCCKNSTGQMQIANQIERSFCDTNYNTATNTTAIIQNAHNDTDRVLARLDAMEMSRKDETIANLRTQLAACGDQNTAQYIINQLTNVISPRAVPCYPAASPCGYNWAPSVLAGGYGFNGGCGCGCGN